MMFLQAFVVGFGLVLGAEVALGLCFAIGAVTRGRKK